MTLFFNYFLIKKNAALVGIENFLKKNYFKKSYWPQFFFLSACQLFLYKQAQIRLPAWLSVNNSKFGPFHAI